ncbi:MAG: DUF3892 domain-containing protein [bacterium]
MAVDYYIKKVCYGGGTSIKEVNTTIALSGDPVTKKDRETVVKDIDKNSKTIHTATKNKNGVWGDGDKVGTVTVDKAKYLRTDGNSIAKDNLGELPTYTDCK